jgi:hypothetical protein
MFDPNTNIVLLLLLSITVFFVSDLVVGNTHIPVWKGFPVIGANNDSMLHPTKLKAKDAL